MKKYLRPGLAVGSGALLALCFPPFNLGWIVWGWMWILLPLLWTSRSEKKRRAGFGIGFLSGLGFWLINLKWIWTVTGLGAVTMALYLAIYFGIFGAFAANSANPWRKEIKVATDIPARFREMWRSLGYAAMLGGWWCGMEWIRGWMLTGFGWNGLGVAFHNNLIMAQNAEFVGVYGLSFLPVFFSAVAVQVGRRFYLQAKEQSVKLLHWDFATAMLVIMGSFTVGSVRFSHAGSGEKIEAKVLLVQQNIPQTAGKVEWPREEILGGFTDLVSGALEDLDAQTHADLKATSAEGSETPVVIRKPDWVIWPEATLVDRFFTLEDGSRVPETMTLSDLLDDIREMGDFTFIAGANEVEGYVEGRYVHRVEHGRYWNSMITLDSERNLETYRKHHLVIFGELVPDVLYLRELYAKVAGVPFIDSFSSGESHEPLDLKVGEETVQAIPSICFEDTVGRLTRKSVRDYPQVIVNITNDGWFKQSEGAAQHFANARFRCIELRRPMVRCANSGVGGVISVTGSTLDPFTREDRRLVDDSGSHFTKGTLFASVWIPRESGFTLYALWGDWFAVVGLALSFLAGIALRLRKS